MLKNAKAIHLGPRLDNFSILNPIDADAFVGDLASGRRCTGKHSAMGSLRCPAHDHPRAFRYHVLDDKTEIRKALPQG